MKRVQMSVYVTPEVAERLKASSKVASVPLGRHVGDMLESMLDSIEYVSVKMAQARRSPAEAFSRLQALDTALEADVSRSRARGGASVKEGAASAAARPHGHGGRTAAEAAHPPSNTGVTTSAKGSRRG
ncbi:hypothetical protein WI72_17065 [Burkholderia ubonensis]|uniref:hypothetical protein n=1 Tax=Burkholderia ubonensis TaxID=101571 RepID=UPI0007521423|nr:hypothetical protein [Burkholderia ubonensis]KVC54842.1 hypothetical protein WI72_17065 [Burkholderia ubonensis]